MILSGLSVSLLVSLLIPLGAINSGSYSEPAGCGSGFYMSALYRLQELSVRSKLECATYCQTESSCKSFNLIENEDGSKSCQLNTGSAGPSGNGIIRASDVSSGNYSFFEKYTGLAEETCSSIGSCPQGQYNANTDSDETCDWCANGVRQGACVACQAGQYQDQYGSSACLPCPSGSYQNESGSAECLPCPPGQFQSVTGSQTCIPCAVGEYQNQNGSTSCLPCPVGQFQSSSGQATCSLCPAGHYQDTIGQTTCSSCPAGQFQNSTGQSTCIQCPEGHYQSSVGQTDCTACPIGQYQSAAGAVSCVSCSSGSTTAATGSTSASDCVVSDPNCGPGYTLQYAGKNYYFGDPKQGRSQEAAQTCCQNMGMILVAINDVQEWNFVDSNVASTSYNGYWCDAECINSVCIWKNSPNSVFYNPGVGGSAIDGAGNEPCLAMKWGGGIDYQDLACTSTSYNAGFVCE